MYVIRSPFKIGWCSEKDDKIVNFTAIMIAGLVKQWSHDILIFSSHTVITEFEVNMS